MVLLFHVFEITSYCNSIVLHIYLQVENTNRNKTQARLQVGSAMAQAVNRRPLTAEARVRSHLIPCGFCGGRGGSGTYFSPSSSVSTCQYHSTVALHTYISSGGCTIGPLCAAVQRHRLAPIDINKDASTLCHQNAIH
jgi:hypothetical protein